VDKLVLGVREAARASGFARDGLYKAIADGRLRVIRRGAAGRRFLIPVAELERFVLSEVNTPISEGPELSTRTLQRPTDATGSRNASYPD